MTANPMLDAALSYASFGWHVLPCEPLRKNPKVALFAASSDPTTITEWWTATPEANIGIEVRLSGLAVIDIPERLAHDLPMSSDPKVVTPSGGVHVYFQGQADLRRQFNLHNLGIDLIALGYVLAPASIVRDFTYRWLQPELVRRTLNPLPAIFRGA